MRISRPVSALISGGVGLVLAACNRGPVLAPTQGLDQRMAKLAQEFKLVPLSPPLGAFKTGRVYYGPNKAGETACWKAAIDSMRSFNTLTVKDSAISGSEVGANLAWLKAIGINISGKSNIIKTLEMSTTDWTEVTSNDLEFQWDPCGSRLEQITSMPVVITVLQFGSLDAHVTTSDGTNLNLADTLSLKAKQLNVDFGGKWETQQGSRINAKGDHLVVGFLAETLSVQSFRCPQNQFVLVHGGALQFQTLAGCAGGDDKWYNVKIEDTGGNPGQAILLFQRGGLGDTTTYKRVANLGSDFLMWNQGLRRDKGRLLRTGNDYQLVVTRFDMCPPNGCNTTRGHLGPGGAAPLDWRDAEKPLHITRTP